MANKKQQKYEEKVIDVTEDFANTPQIQVAGNEEIEVIHCEHCGRSNILSRIPYDRRRKKARHIVLDDATFNAFKMFCIPYGNVNSGLNILMHKALKEKREDY